MPIQRNNQIALCENKRCPIRTKCRRGDFSKRDAFQKYVWRKPDENGNCDLFLEVKND